MRLIKQSSLHFKEGNSDKVYEIDLCDAGNDKYLVNFRYGRRGSLLKEGTKTPVPVLLEEAEKIFSAVEDEKLSKGYTTSEGGVSSIPVAASFTLDESLAGTIPPGWEAMPRGRAKSILQRLEQALQGKPPSTRTPWKLSRIIWKAGEYRIKEAAPYLIRLFNKGELLHQYSCTWALARCGNEFSVTALQSIYREHSSPTIAKIAGAGLLNILTGLEKQQHLEHYLHQLPEAISAAVEAVRVNVLETLLEERSRQTQPQYNWVESLYLLSTDQAWLRPPVKKLLQSLLFQPNYFKHIRAVFKLAELLDDFEVSGLLACRFEREPEGFTHHIPRTDKDEEVYVESIEEWINPHRELLKKNSKVAYSQKTRWYLHRRIQHRLEMLGHTGNTDYVRLATSVLIAYDSTLDFKEAFSTTDYHWDGRNYTNVETRFPPNAHAVSLHWLIQGLRSDLELAHAHIWRFKTGRPSRTAPSGQRNTGGAHSVSNEPLSLIGLFKKLVDFFRKPKAGRGNAGAAAGGVTSGSVAARAVSGGAASVGSEPGMTASRDYVPGGTVRAGLADTGGTPFLHLWNELPQAYVQLLVEGKMEEIHVFAFRNLSAHPAYPEIRTRLDTVVCKKLLLSAYDLPADLGYTVVLERFAGQMPGADLLMALLNSRNVAARDKGRQWTEAHLQELFNQTDFIKDLVFATYPGIRSWAKELLLQHPVTGDTRHAVTGKCIAEMMRFGEQTPQNEAIITDASDTFFQLFLSGEETVPVTVISDLLQQPAPAVLLFGLRLLRARKHDFNPAELSKSFLTGLLQHPYLPVRETGLAFLNGIDADTLLQYRDEMIACCLSPLTDVRQGMAPVLLKMAKRDKRFGEEAASLLMPCLLRKEPSEGVHNDISRLLCNELSGYLQNANKETALKLLYGNYTAAQNVGVTILEKYTDPSQLSLPQVIALGNHENLPVRSWCWKFYREQVARIKYEQASSIKLLESKWTDTRQFAIQYFREFFAEKDWSAEILITLADSVKPEVEAFGRELITRYFDDENGPLYLEKLSQHPSEKMQLFTTNYLERYAGGNAERIRSLELYFRLVLTSVNKNRIAKNRVYRFLLEEGRKSETVAGTVAAILTDISATAAIGDKAACIDVLLQLRSLYELSTPLTINPIETRA
jgi:hypothetical protein